MMSAIRAALVVPALAAVAYLAGCATTEESAQKDTMTANVGVYDPPPSGIIKPRVGVSPFDVTQSKSGPEVADVAADQLTGLAEKSDRFRMIERTQLHKLLKEQGLEGVVRGDEMARPAKIRGVNFLLLGKVTNLRVKAEKSKKGFGFGDIPVPFAGSIGGFDYQNDKSVIKVEVGTDIRLVDPESGEIVASGMGEYNRTDSISAFGIKVLGTGANAEADLKLDEDNKGRLLRLSLNEAMKDMLKKVDRFLPEWTAEQKQKEAAAAPASPAAATPAPEKTDAAAPAAPADEKATGKFCGHCGKAIAADVKFCPHCGKAAE